VAAIGAALPGASWQRCRTHYLRNLLTKVPKSAQPWIATPVRTIFDQPDADAVHAQFDRVVATIDAKSPPRPSTSTTPAMTSSRSPDSPARSGARSGPTNPQERLNKEIRRRTDVVGIFPNRPAIIRLVGAVLAEQTDEWTEGRRYMGLELLAKARLITADTSQHDTDQPDPARDGRLLHHQRGRDLW
jgi:transposase-like protein